MSGVATSTDNSKPAARRVVGRPFPKGVSGNPAGKAKNPLNLELLAKTHTEEAVLTLVDAMRNAPRHADRVTAANSILDRGWGRPAQMILGDPNRPVAIDFRWADSQPIDQQPLTQLTHAVIDAQAEDVEESNRSSP